MVVRSARRLPTSISTPQSVVSKGSKARTAAVHFAAPSCFYFALEATTSRQSHGSLPARAGAGPTATRQAEMSRGRQGRDRRCSIAWLQATRLGPWSRSPPCRTLISVAPLPNSAWARPQRKKCGGREDKRGQATSVGRSVCLPACLSVCLSVCVLPECMCQHIIVLFMCASQAADLCIRVRRACCVVGKLPVGRGLQRRRLAG